MKARVAAGRGPERTVGSRQRQLRDLAASSPSLTSRADGRGSSLLTIGEVARRTEFSIKALRFYERRGLLPASGRTSGGFRLYTDADLHRLEFIRQAKAIGLSLDQIRKLVVTAREQTCSMTRPRLLRALDERIWQTARQIETLSSLKRELERRRRALARRPPTDHTRGYCACLEEPGVALIPRILPLRREIPAASNVNGRKPGGRLGADE